ncbi:MAG: hypothetical protein ACRDTT_36335, partial [Pseudonocardiaceae bacterium]
WLSSTGEEMTGDVWHDESLRTLGMFLTGDGIRSRGPNGERITGDSFLLWVHADTDPVEVTLPAGVWAQHYEVVFDTSVAEQEEAATGHTAGESVTLAGRSCLLLRAAP